MSTTELSKHSSAVLKDLTETVSLLTGEHSDEDCIELLAECLIIQQLPGSINDWLDGIVISPQFVELCDTLEKQRPGVGKWLAQTVNVQHQLYHKENEAIRMRLN